MSIFFFFPPPLVNLHSDPKYISQSPYWVLRFVHSSSHYGTRLTERLQFLGTLFWWTVETTFGLKTPRPLPFPARRMHGISRFTLVLEPVQPTRRYPLFLSVLWKLYGCLLKKKRVFILGENVRCSTIKREPDAGADGLPGVGSPKTVRLQKPLRLAGSRRVKEGFKGTLAGDGRGCHRQVGLRLL